MKNSITSITITIQISIPLRRLTDSEDYNIIIYQEKGCGYTQIGYATCASIIHMKNSIISITITIQISIPLGRLRDIYGQMITIYLEKGCGYTQIGCATCASIMHMKNSITSITITIQISIPLRRLMDCKNYKIII